MDDGVSATLNYVDPESARNRLYVAKGGHMTTTRYAPQTVTIADGRPHAAEFGLDRSGFTLLAHESAVTDFGDPRQLDTTYTAEALDLVKRVTGADEAVSLGWVIRRSAPRRTRARRRPASGARRPRGHPSGTGARQDGGGVPAPR